MFKLSIFDMYNDSWVYRSGVEAYDLLATLSKFNLKNYRWIQDYSEIFEIKYHLLDGKMCKYVVVIQSESDLNIDFNIVDTLLAS